LGLLFSEGLMVYLTWDLGGQGILGEFFRDFFTTGRIWGKGIYREPFLTIAGLIPFGGGFG